MKHSILKSSFSILFCLLVINGIAQRSTDNQQTTGLQQQEDTVASKPRPKKPDSLKEKFQYRSFRIGTDLISLIETPVTKNTPSNKFAGWEINGDADFGKLYFAVDIGQWARAYDIGYGNYGRYENNGSYFRLGADINFLKKDPDRNMFFFGLRYGRSFYNESAMLIFPGDPYFPGSTESLQNTGVTAGWGELVTGLRVKIWKEFWMGYTGRMKFAVSTNGDTQFKSFDIPGVGSNGDGLVFGFNYQVFWRFGVVNVKKPLAK
ncbi:DUF6048 family protein [soil metagenome]